MPEYVYVVAAYDEDTERIKDINVLTRLDKARQVYGELGIIYGKANVCMASREVDNIHMGAPITFEGL